MKIIPYGSQSIYLNDHRLVKKSLNSEFITTGKFVKKFELNLKNYFSSKYALSCSSGTAALHISFKSIDIKEGDVVIMPAINFIAAFNLCSILKAKIYLADVDKNTGQMTPYTLEDCIKKNKLKRIKLILTMYLGGDPKNAFNFFKIKNKYKSYLIEDACHALGGSYKFRNKYYKIGSCKHSDVCIFSLHPLKTITTGEGGIVTTNNKNIYKKIKLYRSHGMVKNNSQHWKYDIFDAGFNYRLSDINSALGISQLNKIQKFIKKREGVAKNYIKNFKDFKDYILVKKINKEKTISAWHLFIVLVNFRKLKIKKDRLLKYLKFKKIIAQFHYIPIYKFKNLLKKYKHKFNIEDFPNCEYYFKNSFSLPIFVNLSLNNQKYIIKTIKSYILKNVKR